jgi:hypothetical protein
MVAKIGFYDDGNGSEEDSGFLIMTPIVVHELKMLRFDDAERA